MAYVCLGRCQEKDDIYIKGKVDPAGIHASPEALEENERLDKIFDENVKKQKDLKETHWIITYLNVRSLKCHKKDVAIDTDLMESDIFSVGETWLKPKETVDFDGFVGHFANFDKGKGVATFSRMDSCTLMDSLASSSISAMYLKVEKFDMIFLYLSNDFNKEELINILNIWIDNERPTAVMGDMNWDASEDCKMKNYMETRGFHQMIEKATCDTGKILDHLYVNEAMKQHNVFFQQSSAYYTDHDKLSLFFPK